MDFYLILGLDRGATVDDVKRAYRRLARKFHPDINPGDRMAAAQFRQIAEAYETLSDPERRRRYDATGHDSDGYQPQTYGFEGFDFTVSVGGAVASTFGDLFGDVLRQRDVAGANTAAERGADLHHSLSLTFEEAVRGAQRAVTITRQEHCRVCGGHGRLNVTETRCTHCHGAGVIKSTRGHMVFSKACAHCGGLGP